MSRELPKPLQDALARQTAGEVHPSPDVLTAFAEHNLPHRENQQVTDHLTKCTDCREVVFLANSAVEETVGEEQEWMAADAISRLSPVMLAKTATPHAPASTGPANVPTRRGWILRWAWVPAVAAVLIVSGILFQRRSELLRTPATVASKGAPPAPTTAPTVSPLPESQPPQSKSALELQKPLAKSAPPQATQTRTAESLAAKIARNAPEESPPAPKASAVPPPSAAAGGSFDALLKAAPAVPMQNGFAESESQTTSNLVAKPSLANPQMAMRSIGAAHRQWHITSDGHLERWSSSEGWTRILADQPVTFHVVSVVGDNVWVGGNGGALFHSSDGGQNWSKQPIGSPPGVETDTIVALRFNDSQHGIVTTDGGSRWSTSDGGVTWTKE